MMMHTSPVADSCKASWKPRHRTVEQYHVLFDDMIEKLMILALVPTTDVAECRCPQTAGGDNL